MYSQDVSKLKKENEKLKMRVKELEEVIDKVTDILANDVFSPLSNIKRTSQNN